MILLALRTWTRQSQQKREMTRDASNAGLFVPQPLLAHLGVFVDAVTGAFLETLDDSARATSNIYLRAAGEAWEPTVEGHHGPSVVGLLITDAERADPTSQEVESSSEVTCVPAREASERMFIASTTVLVD